MIQPAATFAYHAPHWRVHGEGIGRMKSVLLRLMQQFGSVQIRGTPQKALKPKTIRNLMLPLDMWETQVKDLYALCSICVDWCSSCSHKTSKHILIQGALIILQCRLWLQKCNKKWIFIQVESIMGVHWTVSWNWRHGPVFGLSWMVF